jgi:serine/threonine-protein kinase
MEFVEGASLAEILRASGRPDVPGQNRAALSPEEGAYVGVEVCRALDYAHRRMNVVHRDVTPRNVMVDEEGQVKVIDFGIAAPVATAPSGHGVFGSPGHMPPEQMDGKELTPAADVFAVATLLMELWSGKAPFRRHTSEEIEGAMRGPHPRPSDADVRLLPLDDVMASAMSLDPNARPQHADDLGRALRRFLAGVDLGDLARQLGERVRTLRAHPPPPGDERPRVLQRPPSRPSATQIGTKTFAARDEVRALQPLPAVLESSTRRLESKAPSPPPAAREEAIADPVAAPAGGISRLALGVAAGGLAVAGLFLARGAYTTESRSLSAASVAAVHGVAPALLAPSTLLPVASAVSAPASTAAPSAVARTNVAAAVTAERAQLVLLGDGTFVSVDGTPRGACPARIAVEPGTHTVVFSFPPTGESKGESLTLRASDRTTLRADFTGVTPTIRTERP